MFIFFCNNVSAALSSETKTGNTPEFYKELGDSFKNQNKNTEALEAYKKAIEISPNMASAHSGLGGIYGRLKRYDDAIKECELALKLDKNIAKEVLPKLIFLCLFKNDVKAVKYFRILSEVDSKTAESLYPMIFNARIYGISETDGGLQVLITFLGEKETRNIIDDAKMADSFLENREYGKAIDIYKNSITRKDITDKERAVAYYTIGTIYLYNMNMAGEGVEYIKKAIQINPNENKFRAGLIDGYFLRKDYSKAIEVTKNILKTYPSSKYALYMDGVVNFKMGKWGEAIVDWDRLKKVDEIMFAFLENEYNQAHEEYKNNILKGLAKKYQGSQRVVLKNGIILRADVVTKEGDSLFVFFKGNKPTDKKEFEEAVVILLTEVESINGKLVD